MAVYSQTKESKNLYKPLDLGLLQQGPSAGVLHRIYSYVSTWLYMRRIYVYTLVCTQYMCPSIILLYIRGIIPQKKKPVYCVHTVYTHQSSRTRVVLACTQKHVCAMCVIPGVPGALLFFDIPVPGAQKQKDVSIMCYPCNPGRN